MQSEWQTVEGIVQQGHQVASGKAPNSPYSKGTIEMQTPFFLELGLDLTPFFQGTLNISIAPHTFRIHQPEYTFQNLQWHPDYPPEDFSFSSCRIFHEQIPYTGFIYYPHPETKIGHFQDPSTLEVLAPFIRNLSYGDSIILEVNPAEVEILPG